MSQPSSTLFAALPRRRGAGAALALALWATLSAAFVALEAVPLHAGNAERAALAREALRSREAQEAAIEAARRGPLVLARAPVRAPGRSAAADACGCP